MGKNTEDRMEEMEKRLSALEKEELMNKDRVLIEPSKNKKDYRVYWHGGVGILSHRYTPGDLDEWFVKEIQNPDYDETATGDEMYDCIQNFVEFSEKEKKNNG